MKHKITIACSKSNLYKIRNFVAHTLDKYGIPKLKTHNLVLAIDEVCANLIIHANNCNPNQELELTMEVFPKKKIIFIVRDKGVSFDITQYKEPKIKELISKRQKGGLGLILIKKIMDKIELTTENNHNICKLVKIL